RRASTAPATDLVDSASRSPRSHASDRAEARVGYRRARPRAASMPGPLAGFRIVDLTAVVAGPLATALLADQGADVIKVERPSGDIQRHVGSSRAGMSGNFHVLNRGKRSIAVDLKQPRGREIVERLADGADLLVQNFRPGVTDRL